MRVLIPKRPSSVHYHLRGCGNVDDDAAAELAREDAEALGYRAHGCVNGNPFTPGGDDDRREVPA